MSPLACWRGFFYNATLLVGRKSIVNDEVLRIALPQPTHAISAAPTRNARIKKGPRSREVPKGSVICRVGRVVPAPEGDRNTSRREAAAKRPAS